MQWYETVSYTHLDVYKRQELYEPSNENILTPTFGTNYLNNKGEKVFLNIHYATPAFLKLYDITVIEGEIPDINKENRRTVFVVNKAALKALGYTCLLYTSIQMHSGFKCDTFFSEVIYYNILKISKIVEQLQKKQREVNDGRRRCV